MVVYKQAVTDRSGVPGGAILALRAFSTVYCGPV